MTPQPQYPSFGPPPAKPSSLEAPAIGLLVSGGLGVLLGVLGIGVAVIGLVAGTATPALDDPNLPPALQSYLKAMSSGAVSIVSALVGLVVNGLIVYAGLQMRQARNHTLCVVGAGLCCVPCCFHSCCSLFVVPLGIWALVALLSGPTKSLFRD
jgi:hypothetical protein